ncbi:MAG: hypothetical protein HC854_03920 [Flavobacterium sp.]|nr:hypothetical protein [Flavobacterium sp.]
MEKSNSTSDTLLLIVVIWMFLSRLFWAIIPKLFIEYYTLPWFKVVSAFLSLIWACIPILIALSIKDKNKQLITFVIGGLYILHSIYEIMTQFMMDINF